MQTSIIKNWLCFSLVWLISIQSVMAVADMHQSHQSGTEHKQFEHDHTKEIAKEAPIFNEIASTDQDLSEQFDCHHCCHCHSSSPSFINFVYKWIDFFPTSNNLHDYRVHYLYAYITDLLRPPIS